MSQVSKHKWCPVFHVFLYFVFMVVCKSSGLIATSMQVDTIQFYLLPWFQCFFKKEDELKLQASNSGPWIEMCSFISLYKIQRGPSAYGCPLAYTLR